MRLLLALLAGALVAAYGIAQAHALGAGPAAGAALRFDLSGGRTAAEVTLRRPVRTLSLRAGRRWVRCTTSGLHARCPIGSAAGLSRLDLVATR